MIKYIKVIFRDKKMEPLHISLEKWTGILEDPKTLVAFKLDSEDEWTGRVLNKAEIIGAEPDEEYTKKANVAVHDLYHHIPTNTVVRLKRGNLPPPGLEIDYKIINPKT